ncbi:MAG: hypothetical protein HFH80_06695 [Lachnospiraceae bacterium]|nr:hypothetical protein [Lachnospiraceae bacterium]
MNILSNYIWEKAAEGGANPLSMVLQQVRLRGREVCLFCVCSSFRKEQGGRMTEQLVEWFHRCCLPACEGRALPGLRELLEPELAGIRRELRTGGRDARGEDLSYGGLLLAGSSFYLFGEGDMKAQLVNYRYNRPQLKELCFPLSGRIQKGVGILLHAPELTRNLEPQEVCQILHGEGRWQEARMGRRLRELHQESRSRGGTGPVGGIYLRVV